MGHDLNGFGFVVPRAEDRPVMATTWSSSKFPGRAPEGHVLLRSFLGRAGREAAAQLDDDEMTKVVRAELREVMGIAAEPEFVQIFRWPRGMPQYRVGHVELVAKIEAGVARVPGVELAGGAYHGIGIGDCLREGAAAAERALEHVRGLPEDAVPSQPPTCRPATAWSTRGGYSGADASGTRGAGVHPDVRTCLRADARAHVFAPCRAPEPGLPQNSAAQRVPPRRAVHPSVSRPAARPAAPARQGGVMNSWVLYGTIWFIVWVVCLWLVWRMVDRKDLNRALWIILCIFFPVLILIIVALLPHTQAGGAAGDPDLAAEPARSAARGAPIPQYLPTSFQIQRCGACMLKPGLLYITAQCPVMTLRPRFSASASASGVSVIWWIQIC